MFYHGDARLDNKKYRNCLYSYTDYCQGAHDNMGLRVNRKCIITYMIIIAKIIPIGLKVPRRNWLECLIFDGEIPERRVWNFV